MIRLNRHPPNARTARNGVALGLFFYLCIGALCALLLYFALDEPGRGLASGSTFVTGSVGTLSCLLMVLATATALLNRRWATPALVVLAFGMWVIGVIVVIIVAGANADLNIFSQAILLLAARPRLLVKNYLAGLTMVDVQPARPSAG
ncbi:hypothetical protein [Micromonospora sp. 050-3]|uniref:hypothetical protein n=1 Tax=Micromonospora sp. 050-3 TaxID=2789265 RepID=UPI003978DC98